jgi:hypothetical protein
MTRANWFDPQELIGTLTHLGTAESTFKNLSPQRYTSRFMRYSQPSRMMTPNELVQMIRERRSVEEAVEHVLNSEVVAACVEKDHYVRFRDNVHLAFPTCERAIIAGSGNWGFSMKPDFLGRAFSADSDVDLAVIDINLFGRTWDEMREFHRNSWYEMSHRDREKLRRNAENIYCGFASPKWIPNRKNAFRFDCLRKLDHLTSFLVGNRTVNAFFFRNLGEAIDYYKRGFLNLLRNI